jgi:hypothetical protein
MKVLFVLRERGKFGAAQMGEFVLIHAPGVGEEVVIGEEVYQVRDVQWNMNDGRVTVVLSK